MPNLIKLLLAAFLLSMLGGYLFGTAGWVMSVTFVIAAMWLAGKFGVAKGMIPSLTEIPFLTAKTANYVGILALVFLAVSLGWLARLQSLADVSGPASIDLSVTAASVSPASCLASVSSEVRGTGATLNLNAWDLESDTPYSAAVDLTTNVLVFKNGNDFKGTTSDTSDGTLTGFAVGDTVSLYGTGTSYYVDDIIGECVSSQQPSISLNSHQILGETSLQITGYDNTGTTTLSAGPSNMNDYNITLGASAEDNIYLKLKVNVANRAFNFGGWAVAKFYNISEMDPLDDDLGGSYVANPTVTWLENTVVQIDSAGTVTITKDYTPWTRSSPVMLNEWDSIKTKFKIKSTSSDPIGRLNTTDFNGVAVVAFDVQNARGTDGNVYRDFYQHDTNEGSVGLAETDASPIGLQSGVLIAAV